MLKHNLEELDKGQLDFMWNFLRFKLRQFTDKEQAIKAWNRRVDNESD